MSKELTKANELNFKNKKSLNTVQFIINEANEALKDTSRTIKSSSMPDLLMLAVNAGIGVKILPMIGLVLGPIALPIAIAAGAQFFVVNHLMKQKFRKTKELVYKNAVAKQAAIIEALKKERNADKERIAYLEGICRLLQEAIVNLEHDLKMS